MRLFCFGFGYSAEAFVHRLSPRDVVVAGTHRDLSKGSAPGHVTLAAFDGQAPSAATRELLRGATHVLVSVPPDLEGDAVLRHHGSDLAALEELEWIGYLSTVGVYGDCGGAWVDEQVPVRPISERSLRRAQAERAWIAFGQEAGRRVEIFRLAGIYGPGRSVIDNLRSGAARHIVKPGQVFNRIHVDDVARVLTAAIDQPPRHNIYNVADDEPAPPQEVLAYAAELLAIPLPPAVPFGAAGLTGLAASFWAENKRVRNERMRRDLGVELTYPTYREGLRALASV